MKCGREDGRKGRRVPDWEDEGRKLGRGRGGVGWRGKSEVTGCG